MRQLQMMLTVGPVYQSLSDEEIKLAFIAKIYGLAMKGLGYVVGECESNVHGDFTAGWG